MFSLNSSEARQNFPELINEAAYAKERIIVTRRGKRLAAIVPIEDLEALEALELKRDLKDLNAARKSMKKHGTTPWDDVKTEFGS